MSGLVPGLEGDTLLEQMNKLFEPPGNQFFFSLSFLYFIHNATRQPVFFSFIFQYFIDHAARQPRGGRRGRSSSVFQEAGQGSQP